MNIVEILEIEHLYIIISDIIFLKLILNIVKYTV